MASGRKNAPVRPVRKNTGSRASASMSEAYTTAPRTSSDASKITRAVERDPPSRRCCRSRLTMFSVSTIASSTTAPSAIAKPARTIVLIVVPRQYRTSADAVSDRGIVIRLISALRQENRKSASTTTTSSAPRSRASDRLSIEIRTKVAGRKIVVSTSIGRRPGCISAMASSTPSVTSRVLAHGSFSTMSISPSPPLMTASPISGWWSILTSATSFRARTDPSSVGIGTSARSSGPRMASRWAMLSRWFGVSIIPPVPMYPPSEKRRRPASRAFAVVSITSSRDALLSRSRSGSTCTWSISNRSPQIGTFATPGTRSRRARIFQ